MKSIVDKKLWNEIKPNKQKVFESIIGFIKGDPVAVSSCLTEIASDAGRISDALFWNNFKNFLRYGDFDISKLRKLSEKLEDYGNKDDMATRIVKTINDIEGEETARCLANLSQSVINGDITVDNYFRLIHTLRQLIPEDLSYIAQNICKGKFLDNPYLDDYIASGIIREADGGYIYSERAWDLVEHGISRGHHLNRPDKIEPRAVFSLGISDYGDEG